MADRPRNPSPPSGSDPGRGPGGREFGWLYGAKGAGDGAAEPPPEHTRVMATQSRPGTAGAPVQPVPPVQAGPPPAAPAGFGPASEYRAGRVAERGTGRGATSPHETPPLAPQAPRARRRWWRPRRPRLIRTVLLLVLVWVVYTVAVPFLTLHQADAVAWEPSGQRPAEQPGTTYLLVGSDSRAGLSAAQRREYHTGDPSENLSDTIMLLHTGSGPNVLLSIPRDSYVDIPGYGTGKINGAYARGGAELLTRTVEQNTGIRVDHYVEIGLGGVASVVDAVGGITICPEYRMDDTDAGLHVKKGCQTADGRVALAYARSRHAQTNGDLDRVKHQREVVAAIGHKVLSPWSVANPVRWWRLNHAVPDFFRFGKGMSSLDAVKWATAMAHTTGTQGKTCTMPVTDGTAEHWDASRTKPLFAAITGDDTGAITADECTPAGIVGAR